VDHTRGAGGQRRGVDARIFVVAQQQRAAVRCMASQLSQQRSEVAFGERQIDNHQRRLQPVGAFNQRGPVGHHEHACK
jgi:hypothetical protein